jgi:hypothetical protein
MKYTLANVEVDFTGEARAITTTGNLSGTAQIAVVRTPDQLVAEVQVRDLGSQKTEIKLMDFLAPPPPAYGHLNRNGSMTVQRLDNGDWVAPVRALRPGGRDWPTLNYVSLEELDELLGSNVEEWLTELGFTVGTWGELNPAAKRFTNSVAVSIPADKSNLLVLPWALTRVVALMKQLGENKIVDV